MGSAEDKVRARDPGLLSRFRARWQAVAALADDATSPTRFLVSNCLECQLTTSARKILLELAKPYFKNVEWVDNPLEGECIEGTICEVHGKTDPHTAPYIADLDGLDWYKMKRPMSYARIHKNALMVLFWSNAFNGTKDEAPFVDPRERSAFPAEGDKELTDAARWVHPSYLGEGTAGQNTPRAQKQRATQPLPFGS